MTARNSYEDSPYETVDGYVRSALSNPLGFSQLLATGPRANGEESWAIWERAHAAIRRFQAACIVIFREALSGERPQSLLDLILNDSPLHLRENFHRSLADEHWSVPQFFRTDEVHVGRIAEIQCPGSQWGEMVLVERFFRDLSLLDPAAQSFADRFSGHVAMLLGDLAPSVHHLLDNSSAPHSMRFFLASTRPPLRYVGMDQGVKPQDCSLVRTHSFFGLMAENFSKLRLQRAVEGNLYYDYPPHVLFDQKLPLAFPFWDVTRDRFDDDIRQCLLYTYPVTADGFRLLGGEWMSVENFSRQDRSKRAYFLKYAGCDIAINWGARAVFSLRRMGQDECLRRLRAAATDYNRGRPWIIQEGEETQETVSFYARQGGVAEKRMTAKFSGFFGPSGLLGGMSQHRSFYKVHGQDETVVSVIGQPS